VENIACFCYDEKEKWEMPHAEMRIFSFPGYNRYNKQINENKIKQRRSI
jgi:hypothetical protein